VRAHPPESETQAAILRAFNAGSVRLFRNSTGVARADDRTIRYGLCRGSADLIGICDGRFIAVEVKSAKGRLTTEQAAFLGMVRSLGGIAIVARSVDDVANGIEEARRQWKSHSESERKTP
jgi:hypothetical protein